MRFNCPYPRWQDSYITLPDEWLGKHAAKYDEALLKSTGLPSTLRDFAVALSLLDDWQLPGVPKNLETCDFNLLPLHIIGWVNKIVFDSYQLCFIVPKALPSPPTNGATGAQTTTNLTGSFEIAA